MNTHELYTKLELAPVIAAVNSEEELTQALLTDVEVVFVLQSHLMQLQELAKQIKQSGKIAVLHADRVKGLSSDETAIDYIKKSTAFDGIISTKSTIVHYAKKRQLLAIQRFFLLDSSALANVERQLALTKADLVEVLPSVSPKIVKELVKQSRKPLIVGGLIRDKEDVMGALGAGSLAVSTTMASVWSI